jgi:hypothetical protein
MVKSKEVPSGGRKRHYLVRMQVLTNMSLDTDAREIWMSAVDVQAILREKGGYMPDPLFRKLCSTLKSYILRMADRVVQDIDPRRVRKNLGHRPAIKELQNSTALLFKWLHLGEVSNLYYYDEERVFRSMDEKHAWISSRIIDLAKKLKDILLPDTENPQQVSVAYIDDDE